MWPGTVQQYFSRDIFYSKVSFRDQLSTGSGDQWFLQNFIISMCGIKLWKGYENVRLGYKKTVKEEKFSSYSRVYFLWTKKS